MTTECLGEGKIRLRSVVCSSQQPENSKSCEVGVCAEYGGMEKASPQVSELCGESVDVGASPVMVGIIVVLLTAMLTALVMMAMMKISCHECNDSNRISLSLNSKPGVDIPALMLRTGRDPNRVRLVEE